MSGKELVVDLGALRMSDVGRVGGKNASLGEMISQLAGAGVRVPGGFATTADAYRLFLAHGGLAKKVSRRLAGLDSDDVNALAAAGREIRGWIVEQPLSAEFRNAVEAAYAELVFTETLWPDFDDGREFLGHRLELSKVLDSCFILRI